jgi:hypothetical protein
LLAVTEKQKRMVNMKRLIIALAFVIIAPLVLTGCADAPDYRVVRVENVPIMKYDYKSGKTHYRFVQINTEHIKNLNLKATDIGQWESLKDGQVVSLTYDSFDGEIIAFQKIN